MKTLDKYLLRKMAASLIKVLVAFIILYILVDLLSTRREAILKYDVPGDVVLAYYAAMIPQIIGRVAALAMLVCGLLVLGNMAQDNEVTAALAGGVSLRRLVLVPAALAGVFAVGVFALQETIGPRAAQKASAIKGKYFSKNPDIDRPGVSWANLDGGWSVHILKFNRLALTGEHVFAECIRADRVEYIRARRIYWDGNLSRWMLEDGRWAVFEPDLEQKLEDRRITLAAAPIQEPPKRLFALAMESDTKSAASLAADLKYARRRGIPTRHLWVDYYIKFSQPAVAFVMIWLAIPFAMKLRRGGLAISFGVSIAIAIAYLVVYGTGVGLGHVGHLAPFAAAWCANGLFLIVGLVLFVKTPT